MKFSLTTLSACKLKLKLLRDRLQIKFKRKLCKICKQLLLYIHYNEHGAEVKK